MADGERKLSNHVATGESDGTGATITIECGFKPKAVIVQNVDGEALLFWNDLMPEAYGYKVNGTAAGTLANESTHTHAVALDGGVSDATSGGTPAGTNSAPTYTDGATSGALNLATPLFSGTGLTAAGQAMTTTDNQTMTLNQCAGMWLLPATASTPPMLIVSNTAVTGAPAVLTVIGAAATDAGAYKIVKSLAVGTISAPTFTGSALATHTHGPGTLADAASAAGSAHTHTFTGSAGGAAYITSLGITPLFNGFKIGADTDVNVLGENIYWTAFK